MGRKHEPVVVTVRPKLIALAVAIALKGRIPMVLCRRQVYWAGHWQTAGWRAWA